MVKTARLPPFPNSPLLFLFPFISHLLPQKAQVLTQTPYVCEHHLSLTSSSANDLPPICQHKKLLCQGTKGGVGGGSWRKTPHFAIPSSIDYCPGSSFPNFCPVTLFLKQFPSGPLRDLPSRVVVATETYWHSGPTLLSVLEP